MSLTAPPSDVEPRLDREVALLVAAVASHDASAAQALLLATFNVYGIERTVSEVISPVTQAVAYQVRIERLSEHRAHFVAFVVAAALGEVRASVVDPRARTAVLACLPPDRDDLPLELLSALLNTRGWRTVNLGADTPMASVCEAVRISQANACVLAVSRPSGLEPQLPALTQLGAKVPLFLVGPGALALRHRPRGIGVLPLDVLNAATVLDAPRREPRRVADRRIAN